MDQLEINNLLKKYNISLENLKDDERDLIIQSLNELSETGISPTMNNLWEEDYDEVPVSIEEFISSNEYIGKSFKNGKGIYPYWKKKLHQIFSEGSHYEEVIITGAIGIGKTSFVNICLSYILYNLLCLKKPQEYYGLSPTKPIVLAFFNATLFLTEDGAWTQLQSILQNSPWFLRHGSLRGSKNVEYIPEKNIQFIIGSDATHGLGKDIFAGLLDEVDFVKGSNANVLASKMMKTYHAVKQRMKSRFLRSGGDLPAMLFIVSSKKSEQDFIEQYIDKVKHRPEVLVIDEPQWNVKPNDIYSGKRFWLAVGDKYHKHHIIQDDENPEDFKKQGYRVIDVPVEYRQEFEFDIDRAVMDLAGISTTATSKFISYERLVQVYSDRPNPFTTEVLTIGLDDDLQYENFFRPALVPESLWTKPGFLHWDTSLTGDRSGIAYSVIVGAKKTKSYDQLIKDRDAEPEEELFYANLFAIEIQAPASSEISFEKGRQFIYYLKSLGWNIKKVTTDGFQSADNKQILKTKGYDAEIQSLDKTPDGYLTFRASINEKRVSLLRLKEIEDEAINIERDNQSGKVDHPVNGKKDGLDGLAGSIWSASKWKSEYLYYNGDDQEVILDINDHEQSGVQGFINELTQKLSSTSSKVSKSDESIEEDIDSIINSSSQDMISKLTNSLRPSNITQPKNVDRSDESVDLIDDMIIW